MKPDALKTEIAAELNSILHFWSTRCVDEERGGFFGRIDNHNTVDRTAEKGAVLHARILWSFSAAWLHSPRPLYAEQARRAYDYLQTHFIDKDQGGVYWTVDAEGRPAQTKKQVYAQAFALYAFSEYYKLSGDNHARDSAIGLYRLLENRSHDQHYGGYFEAYTQDWKLAEDLRLSAKDANEKKSMNTHLHVLEGYANLYTVWPDPLLKERISEVLRLFITTITDAGTGHLRLFFTDSWEAKGRTVSYGHDIEAAWLLLEAAEIIGDEELCRTCRDLCLRLAGAAREGLDADGGLCYEYEPGSGEMVAEKHWWVQAEAMVGFLTAWSISGAQSDLDTVVRSWQFIKDHILDKKNGEWFWGVTGDYRIMEEDKAGLWKCPYHNSRACLELIRRLSAPTHSNFS